MYLFSSGSTLVTSTLSCLLLLLLSSLFSFSSSDKIQHCVMKWFQVWVSFPKTFLCLQNLLVCYSVQNNEITVIRLSVSIIHALCLFFLKLMKYPPAPLNAHLSTATKACRPNTARVQSLGNVSILAAAKKIHSYVCLLRRKGFLSVLV